MLLCVVTGDTQHCYCIMYCHWRHAVLLLNNVFVTGSMQYYYCIMYIFVTGNTLHSVFVTGDVKYGYCIMNLSLITGDTQYCYCIMHLTGGTQYIATVYYICHWRHVVLLLHNVLSLKACSIVNA